ncbi:uncharacterized protein KRP23_5186 [Phytophthora ramorum]|uniref:uncharacterized protein n=1 Tax=Phytophthora ramorum TaxID=164328 RepID=UPI003096D7BE|nr:hypothetical protein KRP23_5186 [Phytophthora ramorum]
MESMEDGAIARLRVWRVRDDCTQSGNLEGEEGDQLVKEVNVIVRDRRNAYSNALKSKVLDDTNAGLSVTEAATLNGIESRTVVLAWVTKEASIRYACDNKKRSKCSVGGQGRLNSFPHCDEVVQWIKETRRDDFALKTSYVLDFLKVDYADFTTGYLAKNKEESLGRMIQRIIHQRGFSFRWPPKSILSTQNLKDEQRMFASGVGTKVKDTYKRS